MAETKLAKLPPGVAEAFLELIEEPINFHPAIARLCGGANAGLMCSQAIYFSRMKAVQARGGWFYKTAEEWEEETCLSRREQDTAKKTLKEKGYLSTKLEKINGAPTLHFKVNFDVILQDYLKANGVQMENTKPPNGLHETAKSENTETPEAIPETAKTIDCTEPPNQAHKNAKSYKEATTSTTTSSDFSQGGSCSPPLSAINQTHRQLSLTPSVALIAQQRFMDRIGDTWQKAEAEASGPNQARNLFITVRMSAKQCGLDYTLGKIFLSDHPGWFDWPYLKDLDSQQEIIFPDPPKPQPQSAAEEAPWWEKRLSPERYEKAKSKALEYLATKAAKQSTENVRSELGVLLGTMSADGIAEFTESIQRLEASA